MTNKKPIRSLDPVYQVQTPFGWQEVDKETYDDEVAKGILNTRTLYTEEAYQRRLNRIGFLELYVKNLQDALRAYGDEDIDEDIDDGT